MGRGLFSKKSLQRRAPGLSYRQVQAFARIFKVPLSYMSLRLLSPVNKITYCYIFKKS